MQLPFELVSMDHRAQGLSADAYLRLSPFIQISLAVSANNTPKANLRVTGNPQRYTRNRPSVTLANLRVSHLEVVRRTGT
jgi:hypothetical protein